MRVRILLVGVAFLILATLAGFLFRKTRLPHQAAAPFAAPAEPHELPPNAERDSTMPIAAAHNGLSTHDLDVSALPPLAVTFGSPAWEAQVAAARLREKDVTLRARALLDSLPRLPEEALAAVAEQAINELPNSGYASTALPLVTNPATPGQVQSALFADLMERPDAITLPALLAIARNSDHPFAPSALDNLRLLLGVNRGTDWLAWQSEIERRVSNGK